MLSIIHSAALLGIDAYAVNVEVDLSSGLPAFDIVGCRFCCERIQRTGTHCHQKHRADPFQPNVSRSI